ncbi:hypothetical protein EZ428_21435 [Pedobacter frigiditerrae]|uniref:Peptidase MA superfamily protein n=1 Tax=Pedobacter frigiditerrae TaxID=2530452 RepID=A0A4R0MKX0_9SPHI|nr:hypothetical protein [Pedobacter frigiditerrae]TCC87270.1 hypothetical protein EZ428_21435 [Pedobacter frigiditerrae]
MLKGHKIKGLFYGIIIPLFLDSTPSFGQQAPAIWKEHWFEHDLTVNKVYEDDHVVMYHDENMGTEAVWANEVLSKSWAYVKKTYGSFGPDPKLYVVLHKAINNKMGGGHPSPYFDESHDYRNVIDCGLGNWNKPFGEQIGMPIHEIGHLVTSVSHDTKGSPSDIIWGDSKFMEIFNYDVLLHIGREDEAERVFKQMQGQHDSFPREGTQWFKNWFYPIYKQYEGAKVLNSYFTQLAKHFPKDKDNRFTRDLNWGEFIHFWSGAAGVNLQPLAAKAFGWPSNYQHEFAKAQIDFKNVKYTKNTHN